MKKIRFTQPKYIIPLILIPFNAFLFYMLKDSVGQEKEEMVLPEEIEAINPHIPVPNLEKRPMKSKFESFKETYKYNRDFTAMKEIDRREEIGEKLSPKEKEIVDSVNNELMHGRKKDFMSSVKEQTKTYRPPIEKQVKTKASEYEMQMRLFRDQMNYIDSLNRQSEDPIHKPIKASKDSMQSTSSKDEIIQIKKSNDQASTFFNTIRAGNKDQFIQAVIDEDIKVYPGSRVRIRLLDDVYAGDQLIEKGSYLFGIISAFKPQRIEITITSVLVHDEIIAVDMKVYDNDGLQGLYVPASQFREFTRDLASNSMGGQNFQFSDTPENQAEMIYDMAERAFSTTTRTLSKASRKNKAKLKYNTILYLVNAKENN